jgi:hypothetical protein
MRDRSETLTLVTDVLKAINVYTYIYIKVMVITHSSAVNRTSEIDLKIINEKMKFKNFEKISLFLNSRRYQIF